MKTHILYAVRDDNGNNTMAVPDTPDAVPVMRDDDGLTLAAQVKPGMSLNIDMEGAKLSLPLPERAGDILALINGEHPLSAIHAQMENAPDWQNFKREFAQLYGSFYGLSRMFIRKPPG